MADILYAWEFGAGLGHVGAFLPLGRGLRDSGHNVHWAVAKPALAGRLLAPAGFSWVQAPAIAESSRPGMPLSYADILLRFGYGQADDLYGLVGAWRELMRLTGAKLVLADHAPTALLAARSLDIPAMLFSNGFTAPPPRDPLPAMRSWVPVSAAQLEALDRQALTSINAVFARLGKQPLPRLANMFEVAEAALVTFPELDHYADRGPATYWGSLPAASLGQRPASWPKLPGKRLFAYLRPELPHYPAVLAALRSLGQATLVYFPGLPAAERYRYAAPHLVFLDTPADLAQMAKEADVAVTYASVAATTAFLMAGKPLLLLPGHLEQFLLARRVAEMGAGLLIHPEQPAGDLRQPLQRLLTEPFCRDNAAAFARKYAAFDQSKVVDNLVRRIEEILANNREVAQ